VSLADWDKTIRLARQARLLGVLAHRIQSQAECLEKVPDCVLGHLRSATALFGASRADAAHGAGSTGQRAAGRTARGRAQGRGLHRAGALSSPADVCRVTSTCWSAAGELDQAEAALLATRAGSRSRIDAYAERYYREWSHELPPMRFPGHPVEVDLHHTITPVTAVSSLTRQACLPICSRLAGSDSWSCSRSIRSCTQQFISSRIPSCLPTCATWSISTV
jgi:hypothetical protein